METVLMNARSGEEAALTAVAEAVETHAKDADGVYTACVAGKSIYKAGTLLYPVLMDYETKLGKKAGYADLATQLTVLGERLEAAYNLVDAADYVNLLVETLCKMSPEIYEHYKTLLNLLKKYTKYVIAKEDLVLAEFLENALKSDVSGKDSVALALFGKAVLAACEKDLLLAEKYEAVGKACVAV